MMIATPIRLCRSNGGKRAVEKDKLGFLNEGTYLKVFAHCPEFIEVVCLNLDHSLVVCAGLENTVVLHAFCTTSGAPSHSCELRGRYAMVVASCYSPLLVILSWSALDYRHMHDGITPLMRIVFEQHEMNPMKRFASKNCSQPSFDCQSHDTPSATKSPAQPHRY